MSKNFKKLDLKEDEKELYDLLQNFKCFDDTYSWNLAVRAYRLGCRVSIGEDVEKLKNSLLMYERVYEELKEMNATAFKKGYDIAKQEMEYKENGC